MKVKVRKRKPAPIRTEQAKGKSTLELLGKSFNGYGVPKEVHVEHYDKGTSEFLTHDIKGGHSRRLKTEYIRPDNSDVLQAVERINQLKKSNSSETAEQSKEKNALELIREKMLSYGLPKEMLLEIDFIDTSLEKAQEIAAGAERIPISDFVDMVDKIYDFVHSHVIGNSAIQHCPDLKISDMAKFLEL